MIDNLESVTVELCQSCSLVNAGYSRRELNMSWDEYEAILSTLDEFGELASSYDMQDDGDNFARCSACGRWGSVREHHPYVM